MSSSTETKKIALLGPAGSFSHIAAMKFAANAKFVDCEYVFCDSFDMIHEETQKKNVQYGVYPVFNMLFGAVKGSSKIFSQILNKNLPLEHQKENQNEDLVIEGTVVLPIDLALMAKPGVTMDQITDSLSHEAANGQYKKHAAEMKWVQHEASSTADAARRIAEGNDPTIGAVASPQAAEIYKLNVLQSGIQDKIEGQPDNHTIFVVTSLDEQKAVDAIVSKKRKRQALGFAVKDEPGDLATALLAIGEEGINIPYIESFYSQTLQMTFMYCELDAHLSQKRLQKALYKFIDQGRSWQMMDAMDENEYLVNDIQADDGSYEYELSFDVRNKPQDLANALTAIGSTGLNIPYIQSFHDNDRQLTKISCKFKDDASLNQLRTAHQVLVDQDRKQAQVSQVIIKAGLPNPSA